MPKRAVRVSRRVEGFSSEERLTEFEWEGK